MVKPLFAEWPGYCPVCRQPTVFRSKEAWFRDHLLCETCPGGVSIPRERALMLVLESVRPHWRDLRIHESSPVGRGASSVIARECRDYVSTQFFPDVELGAIKNGWRCEDLEEQTFTDEAFDIVVSQDVMEHVFRPDRAYSEIWRTLRFGGVYVHTTPVYKDRVTTECRAKREPDGSTSLLAPAEYHGNPVDSSGSLVTFHYGYDIADRIAEWAPFDVEIRRFCDRTHGIVAEFTEVALCYKR